MTFEAIAIQTALRQRLTVPDELFDRQYPRPQRYRSHNHWTPVEVATRVAELLAASPDGHVLDVGAGVGKVCIVGALATTTMWYGMERDLGMVRLAQRVSRQLGVGHRTLFMHGEATSMDWSPYGGVYLYNPFAESLFTREIIDPGLRRTRYLAEVAATEAKLATLRPGTLVVTYHGFGGEMPDDFKLLEREPARDDELCLWIRR